MAETYDVIVAGLGGVGSAAAYHLAARGKRVLGLEQYTPAHGSSRIIRQAYNEGPGYVPLVQRSYELWEQLERDTNTDLLTITGGLFLGTEGSDVVQGSLRSAREHNLPHELLESKEIRQRFPVLQPPPDHCALYEANAGFLRPEAAVAAHLGLAAQRGADCRLGSYENRHSPRHHDKGRVRSRASGDCTGRMGKQVFEATRPSLACASTCDGMVRPCRWHRRIQAGSLSDLHLADERKRHHIWISGNRLRSLWRKSGDSLRRRCLHCGLPRAKLYSPGHRRDPAAIRDLYPAAERKTAARRNLHVHHDAGRTLRRRAASGLPANLHRLRLLRTRLQVLACSWRSAGRSCDRRTDKISD